MRQRSRNPVMNSVCQLHWKYQDRVRGLISGCFLRPEFWPGDARRLGTAIISHTCNRTRQLQLGSYDRLFPNQDIMPKGGFGNLIALPLQKGPRESGGSIFVDATLRPYPDQWAFLASVIPMNAHDIEPTILRATGNTHPLDVTFINEEDLATPWKPEKPSDTRLNIPLPDSLKVTLANLIYFEKAQLPQCAGQPTDSAGSISEP